MQERLQKVLSRAGITSRRKAEQYILEGRVTVNGAVIRELGSKADIGRDHVKVDGRLVRLPRRQFYLMLNKPRGYVTTMFDPQGRRKVTDLLRGIPTRVYPVGRLDYHSEGLLLFTNDGEFANLIMSASAHVPKTYWVKVDGRLAPAELEKLRRGGWLGGRLTAPAKIRSLRDTSNPWYEVELIEGRQNQIRRMFGSVGHLVEKLKRVQIGFLKLDDLPMGEYRSLTPREVERFRRILPGKAAARGRAHQEGSRASSAAV